MIAAVTAPTLLPAPSAFERQLADFIFCAVKHVTPEDRDRLIAYAYSPFGKTDALYEAGMLALGTPVSAQAVKQCVRERLTQ